MRVDADTVARTLRLLLPEYARKFDVSIQDVRVDEFADQIIADITAIHPAKDGRKRLGRDLEPYFRHQRIELGGRALKMASLSPHSLVDLLQDRLLQTLSLMGIHERERKPFWFTDARGRRKMAYRWEKRS